MHNDKTDKFVAKLLEEDNDIMTRPVIKPLVAKLHIAKSYDGIKQLTVAALQEIAL